MTGEDERSTKGKEWLSCRDVLWILVFTGFALSSGIQSIPHTTIIAMVVPKPRAAAVSQCVYDVASISGLSHLQRTNATENATIGIKHYVPSSENQSTPQKYDDRLDWNEYEQNLALGGLSWLHWIVELPSGFLAHRYGTKLIFGIAVFGLSLLNFLLPLCAYYHLYAFVSVRVVQGVFGGFTWPTMHNMTAKWIPIQDRSRFISSYLGSSLGIALTSVLCAMLSNWFGWESVFYISAVLGVIWSIAWYYLAYNKPQAHPRISEMEKSYIMKNLNNSVHHVSPKTVPWKAILTSGPLWITAIAELGGNWSLFTLVYEAPSYFNYVHGWNISAAAVFSAIPQIGRMLFSYAFSVFADWLKRSNKMSTTNLRKFATFVCNGVQGIMMLGVAFSGCHPILAIVFINVGMAVSGALSAGALASCIDLSPNYASILFGISDTMTWAFTSVIPVMVGILTNNNQTIGQWRLVFLIAAAVQFATGALYIFFGNSEVQPWNDVKIEENGEELQNLRSNVGEADYVEVNAEITKRQMGTSAA